MNDLTDAAAIVPILLGIGALDHWLGVPADGIAFDLLIVSTLALAWAAAFRRRRGDT